MRRLTVMVAMVAFGLALALAGCSGTGGAPSSGTADPQGASQKPVAQTTTQQPATAGTEQGNDKKEADTMKLSIDGTNVNVAWENNQAVSDLKALASKGPVTINLSMYGGFEQVGLIGASLTASDTRMTTEPGDIVLYAGNQISIFYGANTWAYTKLGHITDKTADEMADLLGDGDVAITISVR